MQLVIYIYSFLMIGAGACYILYTEESRTQVKTYITKLNNKVAGIMAACGGILLMAAASSSTQVWFVAILGFLGLAKGVLFFFNPSGAYEKTTDWYLNQATDQTYRLFGIIMLILGTALFSWV